VRTKQRKKIGRRPRLAAPMAVGANVCWSMASVSDKLADGRSFRILTAVDQFTERMCMSGSRSEKERAERGSLPTSITVDKGSEFCSRDLEGVGNKARGQLCFIRPSRPVENRFIESFNGRLRDECLKWSRFPRWKMPGRSWRSSESTTLTNVRKARWRPDTGGIRGVAQVKQRQS
jgi:putative transposase